MCKKLSQKIKPFWRYFMLNNQAIWLTKLIFEPKPKSKTIKLLEMTEPISCFFGYAISCFYPHAGISTIAQSSVLTYCIFNIRNYFSMPRCGWAQLCRALRTFLKKKKKKKIPWHFQVSYDNCRENPMAFY